MRVPRASATDCPLPKFDTVAIGHGHLLALTILIGPDCSTTMRLPLASVPDTPKQPVSSSAQTTSGMSARVMSDTTRWRRAVAGVGTEVGGGQFKSCSGHKVSSLAERPQGPSESPTLT
jgi:hypothetical protein